MAVVVGAGLCVSVAAAKPKPGTYTPGKTTRTVMGPYVAPDGPPVLNENFDSLALGNIIGQNGWQGWFGTVPDPEGYVVNTHSSSPSQSLRITSQTATGSTTDVVQVFNITGGKWKFTGKTYVPSTTTGNGYWILLNTYPTFNWSVQVHFEPDLNQVIADPAQANLPTTVMTPVTLVEDQWVAHETIIDLTAGTYDFKYNGQMVVDEGNWGPNLTLQALDCYSNTIVDMFYDDLMLVEDSGCYPDCNASGTLTIADFGCFQAAFSNNLPYADCNNSGGLTIADFGCFQAAFVAGCP
jgi:hypothetical protein